MNPQTLAEAKTLFDSIRKGIKNTCPELSRRVEVVICPPFIYLSELKTTDSKLKLGGQDCFWEDKGAFTGEISTKQLKNSGCNFVIIGHSEREKYFSETDEVANKKIKSAIKSKIRPIFCIGDTLEDRKRGNVQQTLTCQIKKGLRGVRQSEVKNLILAYEPVWAIGTGKPCSANEVQKINLCLRKILTKFYSVKISQNMLILYGGSVNSKNARAYITEAGMQGLLIGGASLNAKEFIKIIKEVAGS